MGVNVIISWRNGDFFHFSYFIPPKVKYQEIKVLMLNTNELILQSVFDRLLYVRLNFPLVRSQKVDPNPFIIKNHRQMLISDFYRIIRCSRVIATL